MWQQLLISDADHHLSDLYHRFFRASGYAVRVANGGVECLTALRETRPNVHVLDAELKWGGADGVLTMMDEADGLSKSPIVLLNEPNKEGAANAEGLLNRSHSLDCSTEVLMWPTQGSLSPPMNSPNMVPRTFRIVDRLNKPFYFQDLLASIRAASSDASDATPVKASASLPRSMTHRQQAG